MVNGYMNNYSYSPYNMMMGGMGNMGGLSGLMGGMGGYDMFGGMGAMGGMNPMAMMSGMGMMGGMGMGYPGMMRQIPNWPAQQFYHTYGQYMFEREILRNLNQNFDMFDKNHDGALNRVEMSGMNPASQRERATYDFLNRNMPVMMFAVNENIEGEIHKKGITPADINALAESGMSLMDNFSVLRLDARDSFNAVEMTPYAIEQTLYSKGYDFIGA